MFFDTSLRAAPAHRTGKDNKASGCAEKRGSNKALDGADAFPLNANDYQLHSLRLTLTHQTNGQLSDAF
jgi:hypothetical protein